MKNMINKKRTTITTSMVVAMLVVTAMAISKLMGFSFADNGEFDGKYIIMNEKKMTAQYAGVSNKSATAVSVPDTMSLSGKDYKVTSIKANALKSNTKVKKLTIGTNIKTIGKKAFYGCKNLKTVTINTTKLTISSVKADAFKGLNSKATITVPKNKLASYKKILKAKGFNGKNQKVVGKKKEEKIPEIIFDEDHPLPDPEEAICSISNIAKAGSDHFDTMKVAETTKYSANDSIPFSARVCMPPALYGQFGTREAYGKWIRCSVCGRRFSSRENQAIHLCMSNECFYASEEYPEQKEVYTESYWVPDESPCKVVFHVTLPDGISYQENSMKLLRSNDIEIDSSAYHAEISGQEITVTIDDIKAMPYFSYDSYDDGNDYGGFRDPISILFNAKMNDDITVANTATASVSYTYKGLEKTIDLGDLTVYASSLQLKNTDATGNAIDGSKFVLFKEKLVYNSANIGVPQYFEVAEAESADGLLTFTGLGEGKYKLVQTEVPEGFKKMNSLIFVVSMKGENGNITSLSAKNQLGKKLSWDADSKTGVISATIVNQ